MRGLAVSTSNAGLVSRNLEGVGAVVRGRRYSHLQGDCVVCAHRAMMQGGDVVNGI